MKLKLILTLAICPFWAFAQKSLQVSGHILDKNTAEGLPFATVALLDSDKKLVSGTTTDESGSFQIALVRRDTFFVKVQYVGFQSLDTLLTVNEDRSGFNLMLLLAPNTGQLSEVVISSEKSVGSFQMDKQTFNVAKLGNISSGTGLDVLQRLPSVTINAEGKILMRGNAEFLVTVNGKFTNQTAADVLAQLPANTIETIEIITSPSASQDAEGKAGIINIVTKQKTAEGWGITANVNASGKARFGGDFTYFQTKKRFNFFFTANLRRYDIGGYRLGEIRTLVQDTVTYSPSGGDRPTAETIYGVRAGTTFNISKSVSLNGGIYYGYKQNDRIAKLNYRQFSSTAQPLDLYRRFDEQTLERTFYNETCLCGQAIFSLPTLILLNFLKIAAKLPLLPFMNTPFWVARYETKTVLHRTVK